MEPFSLFSAPPSPLLPLDSRRIRAISTNLLFLSFFYTFHRAILYSLSSINKLPLRYLFPTHHPPSSIFPFVCHQISPYPPTILLYLSYLLANSDLRAGHDSRILTYKLCKSVEHRQVESPDKASHATRRLPPPLP